MKKVLALFLVITLFWSCGEDLDDNVSTQANVKFNLTHSFGNTEVTLDNFTDLDLTNANGEVLNIERIRYLISRIELVKSDGVTYRLKDYNFTDLSDSSSYNFNGDISIPSGIYTLRLVWGFNEEDNLDAAYTDLNTASWNWPAMLGGGYHFLQFDGKYNVNTTTPSSFNYHNGTAKKADGTFEQNFATIDLPTAIFVENTTSIELKFDISELFKNPNTWDLNVLDTPLMPNYDAQKMMQANVQSVFSIGEVTN
jgi:hypothetical protein